MDLAYFGELAANGALVGLMYALVALGLVLIYKASGVANLAQGALAMVGGYLAWAIAALVGLPIWAAIPLSLLAVFLLGRVIERLTLRYMIGQPAIMIIMLTIGIEIMLRGIVPGLLGAGVKPLDLGIDQSPLFVGPMLINRAYLIGGGIAFLFIVLSMLFFNSRQGIVLRAVSDDQTASWAVGIWVEKAIGLSWGLAGVAGASAGILWGSVQGVDWTLSLLLVKALAVAILGGLDSVPGVLVAGLIVGIGENVIPGVLDQMVGGGTRDIVASVIILLTVLVRPYGLFGREQIERV